MLPPCIDLSYPHQIFKSPLPLCSQHLWETLVSNREKINERLSELKTWLLSCSYHLTITEKAFSNTKLKWPVPKKEDQVILFVSTYYRNFDSKSIYITVNSLLSNVKDNKLKKYLTNVKLIHALKQPKNLLRLLSKLKVQNCISEKYGLLL